MTKSQAFKFLEMSGLVAAEEHVQEAYAAAYRAGYSVVEIARQAGIKSAAYIHASLVQRKVLPQAKAGRRKKGSTPSGLDYYLAGRGLSFQKWCAGWGLDEAEAVQQVKAKQGPAFEAIKRDFPGLAKKLTGKMPDRLPATTFEQQRFECNLRWDGFNGCRRATLVRDGEEVPSVVAYGPTIYTAIRNLQQLHRSSVTVERMELLLNKKSEMQDVW